MLAQLCCFHTFTRPIQHGVVPLPCASNGLPFNFSTVFLALPCLPSSTPADVNASVYWLLPPVLTLRHVPEQSTPSIPTLVLNGFEKRK